MYFSASCTVRSPRRGGWERLQAPLRTVVELALTCDAKQGLTFRPPKVRPTDIPSSLAYVKPTLRARTVIAFTAPSRGEFP